MLVKPSYELMLKTLYYREWYAILLMWIRHVKSALRGKTNLSQGSEQILKVAVLLLVVCCVWFCSKRGHINSKRWTKASTVKRNFSWNSLGFLIHCIEKLSFLEIPRLAHNLTSQQLVEYLFTRRRHFGTPIPSSEVILYVYKWHANWILHLWFTSWTLVKIQLDSCQSFIEFDTHHLLHV